MHLRSLVLMGLCAALGVATPALAETASSSKTFLFSSTKQSDDDASKAETAKPKKKLTAKEKAKAKKEAAMAAKAKNGAKAKADDKLAKAKEEKLAKAKEAAEAKAEAKQKLQAKIDAKIAKARADAKLAAKAQAEKLAMIKADAKLAAEAKEEARAAAKMKAAELAKARRDRRLARTEPLRPLAEVELEPIDVAMTGNIAVTGNNGELRSEAQKQEVNKGFFQALFGGKQASRSSLLPETRALDAALQAKQARKQFKVKPEYEPQEVEFSGYAPGTIVIDTSERRLYLVESFGSARRYAIAVGREGLQYKGTVAVGDKQEWPRWIPTLEMQKREPAHYGKYKDGMPGGGENPLGARAIYLYEGKKDTHLRIHGTIAPQTIGTSASNGCFRMINEHVMDLYSRVKVGTKVVII